VTALAPDRLEGLLRDYLRDAPETPGVLACVETRTGERTIAAVGFADRARRTPLWRDATFRLASNTKTFTAAAVLRLVEDGRLRLEDPVARFLPADLVQELHVIDGVSRGAELTLLQLLRHTSGLRAPTNEGLMDHVLAHPDQRWTPRGRVEWVASQGPAAFAPGARHEYNDSGYVLLAMTIEQVAGMPLAEAFRLLLGLDRPGLEAIHLESLEAVPPAAGPRMPQYLGDLDVGVLDPSFDLWGGGGLVSDVAGLAGFWRALFGGEVFRSPATLELMCTTIDSGLPEGWDRVGLGVFGDVIGRRVWTHAGFWGTAALHVPPGGATIALAKNRSDTPPAPFRRLQERIVLATAAGDGEERP
jgi:D-alanyl-D-alanine carboxypeptidase